MTRGVNRQAVFFQDRDYALYRKALEEAAAEHLCQIHAYVLMTNHVHLLVTPGRARSLPLMMQAMGRTYVQRLNFLYGRTGPLWNGRYKASLVQTDRYLLACQRYIELNPVRAGMVATADAYPHSSYGHHALGERDQLVQSHELYLRLDADPHKRRQDYRDLCRERMSDAQLTHFRVQTNACAVIGDRRFKTQIATMLGREVACDVRD